jgi:ketosteroid isomerase-like protein
MSAVREQVRSPEDLTRLFAEFANARDAEWMSALYESRAVLTYPPGTVTKGRDAIRELYRGMLAGGPNIQAEVTLPTLINGDPALTSTYRRDGAGIRVQVARHQANGSWLRIIDRPETVPAPPDQQNCAPTLDAGRGER